MVKKPSGTADYAGSTNTPIYNSVDAGKALPSDSGTRFDLEQQILRCWNILDDLELAAQQGEDQLRDRVQAIICIYNMHFDHLFALFEEDIKTR